MKKYVLLAIILLLFYSCKEDSLNKYIFIPDKDDPRMPAYTEFGYNTFGAKYEDSYFLSSDYSSFNISYQNGKLNLCLQGCQENTENPLSESMSLIFSFPTLPTKETYQDLAALDGITVDLTDDSCNMIINKENQTDTLIVSNGHLIFKRVQLLRIDDEENRAILSGTFDAKFFRNNIPETMSNGRFDLGITEVYLYYIRE